MLKLMARCIIKISGWTLVGDAPTLEKAVFIAAPHTSNWDGFWLLVAKCGLDIDVRFLAKHTLFWWPLGALLRAFGAMPIDRSASASTVDVMVQMFAHTDQLFLALAPEGTRRWCPYWKTGFYRIAKAADVPIILAFIDYREKRMGIGTILPANQSEGEDLSFMRNFYEPFVGRNPECRSPVEFPPE
jgi:1-acyl-sn-glycerol-3-phosphate acyltransferase